MMKRINTRNSRVLPLTTPPWANQDMDKGDDWNVGGDNLLRFADQFSPCCA